jgi:hypothetical protein
MAEPARETPSPRPTPARRGAAKRRQSLKPREQEIVLHGHRMSYRTGGEGPVVLLIHGITGTSEQWNDVFPLLACERPRFLAGMDAPDRHPKRTAGPADDLWPARQQR